MNRHTLSERVHAETGLTVQELSDQLGLNQQTLRKYHKENRLMVRIILAGYRSEVMKGGSSRDGAVYGDCKDERSQKADQVEVSIPQSPATKWLTRSWRSA